MTLHTALRTLGWLAGTLFPQQALRVLQGRDFNAALGRVDDALAVAEERVEVWEPAQPSLDSLLEAYWRAKTPEVETQALEDLQRYYPDGDWKLQPNAPKWVRDLVAPSDFPGCAGPCAQAADLDDHRPACAARAADSPAADERIPDQRPAAGRTRDPGVFDRDAYMAGLTWPKPKESTMNGPSLNETSPELLAALKALGREYGPTGVARTAQQLVDSRQQRHMMTVEQQQELTQFVNRNSLENGCDMPDFAIAAFLTQCYQALCIAAESKVDWTQIIAPATDAANRTAERLDGAK